ncbi:ABC transporter ATP-binding protein [Gephyromycinifex aptenodytis]|uniref:ABC transporter ATP-binding protein n=1 Tax=Gephyromycinifex aptenodytis TaxID=2716227 RepID=UPI001D021310|nr:ABC transporter ATP-binding protein [Gephyromycinifex aptenodytis]
MRGPQRPVIDVHDVCFRYQGGEYGLDEVSFTADAGTVSLLCGPSGSGKTTALRLLNGLVPHFHEGRITGSVTVAGVDVPSRPLHEAGLTSATVFQNPRTQFFTDEVGSELAFGNENLGVARAETLRRLQHAAAVTNTTALLDRRLSQLSGGQIQRVACAAAIAATTPVLLFDEPSSNLSSDTIGQLREILAQQKAAGRTIVVAEHRLYYLRELVDQVFYFDRGRLRYRFEGAEFFALSEQTRCDLGLRRLTPPSGRRPAPPVPPREPGAWPRAGADSLLVSRPEDPRHRVRLLPQRHHHRHHRPQRMRQDHPG